MKSNNYIKFLSSLSVEEKKIAPKNLFHEGDFSLLTSGTRVSVVGSRKASKDGLKRAEIITKELVKRNIIVVSGLALGIDTVAHKTTIENNGKTITVLGTPLDKCTPIDNLPLLNDLKLNHLAISQFEVGSTINKFNFPKRNQTMALISDATIIIEASEKSGTRHQGWESLRLGRLVFLMESLVVDKSLSWPQKMIDYGAVILTRDNYEGIFKEMSEYYPSLMA